MSTDLVRSLFGQFRKINPFHRAGKIIANTMSTFHSRRSKIALVKINKQGSSMFWSHPDGDSFRTLGASTSLVGLKADTGVFPSWKHYVMFCMELWLSKLH